MSVSNIRQCRNLKGMIEYCITPKAGQENNRVAAMYSDLGSSEVFLKYGEETIKAHHRKIQGFTLLQSFPKHEFDVKNESHIVYANELGRKLAYELYPNSPCLVITHSDSVGECLHNHIIVLNHDLVSDGCIKSNRHYRYVKRANDRLMERYGLEVCAPSKNCQTQGEYWSNKRNGWIDELKTKVDTSLSNVSTIQEFYDSLLEQGITPLFYKKNGSLREHFTYQITDSNGVIHKKRSDKLGERYSRKSIEQTLLLHKQEKEKKQKSIMSMSDWIRLQHKKENDEIKEKIFETSADTLKELPQKSKQGLPAIPERTTEMKKQNDKSADKPITRKKEYEKKKRERLNIVNQINQLNKKFDDDSYTQDDFEELKRLEREMRAIDIILNSLTLDLTSKINECLDESLLPKRQYNTEADFSL